MVEAYRIGISIAYRYKGSAAFAAMARDLQKIDRLAKAAEQALGGVGKASATGAAAMSKAFAAETTATVDRMTRAMGRAQGDMASGWSEAFTRSQSASERAAAAWGMGTGQAAGRAFNEELKRSITMPALPMVPNGQSPLGPQVQLPEQVLRPIRQDRALMPLAPRYVVPDEPRYLVPEAAYQMPVIGSGATESARATRVGRNMLPPGGGGGGVALPSPAGGGRGRGPAIPNVAYGPGGAGGGGVPPGGGAGAGGAPGGGFPASGLMAAYGVERLGDAGMSFFEKAFMAEAQVEHLLTNLRMNGGVDDAKIAEVRSKAEAMARAVKGTTISENLKTVLDAFNLTGDLGEALKAAPAMAKMGLLLQSIPGAHHGDPAYAGAQAIEVAQRFYNPKTHAIDMDQFNQQLAAMTGVSLATANRVTPETYLAFVKQARLGGMLGNDQFLYQDAPALLAATGGQRSGTGDAAIVRQLTLGRMTKNAFLELQKVGVLDQTAKWSHALVPDIGKHLAGADLLAQNPVDWARKFLIPELNAHGVNTNDRQATGIEAGKLASTNMGLGFLSELLLGMAQIDKEAAKIRAIVTDPMAVLQNDPLQKLREFQAAENEFMVTLGSAIMGPAIDSLRGLTNVLHDLTDWSRANPNAAKDIAVTAAGLSLLAKTAGEVALGIYVGAPLVRGIVALAGGASLFGAGSAAAMGLAALPALLGGVAAAAGFALKGAAKIEEAHADDPTWQARSMGIPLPSERYKPVPVGGIIGDGSDDPSPMAAGRLALGGLPAADGFGQPPFVPTFKIPDQMAFPGSLPVTDLIPPMPALPDIKVPKIPQVSSDPGTGAAPTAAIGLARGGSWATPDSPSPMWGARTVQADDPQMTELIEAVNKLVDKDTSVTLEMDGRTMGQAILDSAAKSLNGPRSGIAGFDPTQSYSPVR
jgi:hypothetical protein